MNIIVYERQNKPVDPEWLKRIQAVFEHYEALGSVQAVADALARKDTK